MFRTRFYTGLPSCLGELAVSSSGPEQKTLLFLSAARIDLIDIVVCVRFSRTICVAMVGNFISEIDKSRARYGIIDNILM